ncbi:MAG: Type 1 glutamine amidotransferase-like domain-containing protein [Candidatus Falkowbacteria bacterium]|nr:Type 1 glutamine amidotransferase-like domain-containing protein [Candidatus Falkowbacteria bacterium]
MTKYILAGGYVHKAADGGKAFCEELVKGIKRNPIKILDCVFARTRDCWEETLESDNFLLSKFIKNFQLDLALPEKFLEQIKESDVIFLKGGETEMLIEALKKDLGWQKELTGKVLAGTSAGAEMMAEYYCDFIKPKAVKGFGLLPIKFVSHWQSSDYQDIDWDKALKKLKDHGEDLEIIKLKEGEFKVIEK